MSQSLGQLFAEVWDLTDQLVATITDDEVDEKLEELRTWARLEKALAEPLPPCEMRTSDEVPFPPGKTPAPCGRPAETVLTFTCSRPCREPWRRSACAPCVADVKSLPPQYWRCGYCSAAIDIGGLS